MDGRHHVITTAIGEITVTARGDAVTGVYFPGHRYPPTPERLGEQVPCDELLREAGAQLHAYLAGERDTFELPLHAEGSQFERAVWAALRRIPYGATTTYGTLALNVGGPTLARRVGQAVGHNPLSIIVPCHRVIGADGRLTGYAGGLERKRFLLELEGAAVDALLF